MVYLLKSGLLAIICGDVKESSAAVQKQRGSGKAHVISEIPTVVESITIDILITDVKDRSETEASDVEKDTGKQQECCRCIRERSDPLVETGVHRKRCYANEQTKEKECEGHG